jgi:hypothetical protein
MHSWREQATENLDRCGEQSWIELGLAFVEELGEAAQALLEYEFEDGDAERIPSELRDCGALGYQIYWKRHGYPADVNVDGGGDGVE